jgi:hypothetical protein
MTHYHIRAIALGRLLVGTIEATDIHAALKIFVKRVADGVIPIKEEVGFYQRKKVQITYEEVTHGTTRVDSGEIRSRTQVGQVGTTVKS